MKSLMKKILVVSSVSAFSLVGLVGCSDSSSASNEDDGFVIGLDVKGSENTVVSISEASKFSNSFFKNFVSEMNSHKKSHGDKSIKNKPVEYFEKNFPKTLSAVSDLDEGINFIVASEFIFNNLKVSSITAREDLMDQVGSNVEFEISDVKWVVDGNESQGRKDSSQEFKKFVVSEVGGELKFSELSSDGVQRVGPTSDALTKVARNAAKEIN